MQIKKTNLKINKMYGFSSNRTIRQNHEDHILTKYHK